MTRILYIGPGDNPHTWKWVNWFNKKYPGEISLLPYQANAPKDMLPGVEILEPYIPQFKIASTSSWTEIGRVKRLVHEIRPKLLHVLWAYGSGTYGVRADYHPMVLSPWGSDITVYPTRTGIKGAIQKRLVVEALKKADHLTATSKFLCKAIEELVPDSKKPEIFPYGVDTSMFDPDRDDIKPLKFDWSDGAPEGDLAVTVGFFKSLEPQYGPEFLVDAISRASSVIYGLRCVMAGSGSMKEHLIERVKSLGVENRFVFPGRIPYNDMPRAYMGIDIFAMPSRYEVLGVAALEASAMRKPVIVSHKWGMIEVVEENKTGLFIEVGDVHELAENLVKLGRNRDLRLSMGKAGREFVKKNFEFENIMTQADKFCSTLIKA